MNLFRSEEHVRNWSGWSDETAGGLVPLAGMMEIFSAPHFRERMNGRYISSLPELRSNWSGTIARITGNDPFWSIPAP